MADDADRGVRLDAASRAHLAVPKAAAINWAMPADRRLDQLVDLANEAGASTSRAELAAAIVLATDPDERSLLQMIIRWRTVRVREVVLGIERDAEVVVLPRFGPGRRRRRGA